MIAFRYLPLQGSQEIPPYTLRPDPELLPTARRTPQTACSLLPQPSPSTGRLWLAKPALCALRPELPLPAMYHTFLLNLIHLLKNGSSI